jgi:hypothetical protein
VEDFGETTIMDDDCTALVLCFMGDRAEDIPRDRFFGGGDAQA